MTYEVWSVPSGNLVGAYGSEGEALAALGRRAQHHGSDSIGMLALAREDDDGNTEQLQAGEELLHRVEAALQPAAQPELAF